MDDFEWMRPGMTLRTAAELQAARKAEAERFQAIAMQYVPDSYTVEYRKSLSGKLNPGTSPGHPQVALQLLARVRPSHLHRDRKPKAHVREIEAEQWAHGKTREHGIPVPRDMTKRAKQYVARKIRVAIACGAKRIDANARRFAKPA
jgi:hypothetical protein